MQSWTVRVERAAQRDLRRLTPEVAERIARFLRERLTGTIDPRAGGKPLAGQARGLWRYRVGDYRVIAEIRDREILILVVRVGHRREVYDR